MSDRYVKAPAAVLHYQYDWSEWLADGETITQADVTVDAPLVLDSKAEDDTTVTVKLSGGERGATYKVPCQITTSSDQVDVRTLTLDVADR